MLTAAELIQALQRRMPLVDSHQRRAAGEFPSGWQDWLASMHERAGAVTGAAAPALVDIFLQRPLASAPRRALLLNRWQAFATLWRQQWHPAGRDDRKLRWFASAVSALWHVFFGALLLWLMYLQYTAVGPPPLGEDVVQVEFIGQGAPIETGGGPAAVDPNDEQPTPSEQAAAASETTASAAMAVIDPATAPPGMVAPPPDIAQRDVPEPLLPAPSVEQRVAVSEPTPSQTTVFVLPPPTPRVSEMPAAPTLVAPRTTIRAIEVPEPVQRISRALPSPELAARPIDSQVPQVAARDVPAPLRRAPVPELPQRDIAIPQLGMPTRAVRAVEIPAPSAPRTPVAQAAAATTASRTSPAGANSRLAPPVAVRSPSSGRATPAPASTAGAGPQPAAAPGGSPTPTKGDDWGDSTRNRPGGQRGVPGGVYNADGSVRLADTPGSASPGQPPGTIDDRITNLDRAGTWLKRKPNDYEPTTFDQYWRPNENLLQEWVRKSITTVRIPIPGTNKHIVCKTVLLALGGGCGITDPNLNDQPASARPPPDIPFKPQLQDDNGSIRPAGSSTGG